MVINMYDEENVDIEEQIYNRVLQEEIEQEQKEISSLYDEDSENVNDEDEEIVDTNVKVNKNTFIYEQKITQKKKKKFIFTYKPTNIIYEASVIGQDNSNSDKFVFKAKEYKTDNPEKIRIFKFQDLKNIRYKINNKN